MQSNAVVEGPDSEFIGLSYLFFRMRDEFRTALVKRALVWRERASPDARAGLNKAIKDNLIVDGFRNAALAPAPRLLGPVADSTQNRDDLAAAALAVWTESEEELRVLVSNHLEGCGIATQEVDFPGNMVRWAPVDDARADALASFLEQHPEVDEDDLMLMMDCATGVVAIAEASEDESAQPGAGLVEDMLADTLHLLAVLPSNAPEWEQAIPGFLEAVTQLAELKAEARNLAGAVDRLLTEIRDQYPQLIAYFEWNSRSWSSENLSPGSGLKTLQEAAWGLQGLLSRYAPVHERGPVLAEELARAELRGELTPQIFEAGAALDAMMEPGDDADDEEPEPARPVNGDPVNEGPYLGGGEEPENPEAAVEDPVAPETEPTESPGKLPADESVSDGFQGFYEIEPCYIEDYLLLRLGNQDLEQENDDLERELQSLKEQLFQSRNKEEGFRLALASQDGGNGEETLEFHDVNAAVDLAKERFGPQLLFQLNSESSVEENPFKWPDRVWKALEWLATSYYDSRTGAAKNPDLDGSCRRASEMWYKTSQHDTTMTAYRSSYTTKVRGRTVWLREHIGKGDSFDPRRTIRIGFDWDRGERKVIIGYIGRHQRTSAS